MIVRTNYQHQENKIYIYDDLIQSNNSPIKTFNTEDEYDHDPSSKES